MRFIEHGPDIPDELLLALDEERKVMFFCGAGVSQAGAELPGFLELGRTGFGGSSGFTDRARASNIKHRKA